MCKTLAPGPATFSERKATMAIANDPTSLVALVEVVSKTSQEVRMEILFTTPTSGVGSMGSCSASFS